MRRICPQSLWCVIFSFLVVAVVGSIVVSEEKAHVVFPPTKGDYQVLIVKVIDGDTVRIAHLVTDTVRLYGCNAPELHDKGGKESAERLRELLPEGTLVNATLLGREKYGRLLADFVTKQGFMASKTMIDIGAAAKWDGTGPKPKPKIE